MFSNFMLPSAGAFTIDGTLILAIGVLAVIGIVYKYRSNISLTNTDIIIDEDTNSNKNVRYTKNESNASVEDVEDNLGDTVLQNEEKMEVYN
ncbi:hypothetical protein PXD04_02440 [Methanosphaera sp. ISO3-F5]|uniref:hypothetical protein n=1 Tax=Methanosphaera sp. ISO3-F5 TaxID=1452353 RepID=UPI002B259747|nr:hypothetical protein [Methanosphaera sp. ISO3-F5]WQH64674.1 hypothetical protein PXD04_02440 [Methanosphaera sp. ISO3-F5]